MPAINGSKKILNLHTNDIFDIECTDAINVNEPLTSVGKFHFYTSAFEKANLIVLAALKQKPDWLVIDEAGKLELDGKGFYKAILKACIVYDNSEEKGNLLIIVRDSLCAEVISFFHLQNYKVIHQLHKLK